MKLVVEITENLRNAIPNPDILIHHFREWKTASELDEDNFYLFGKDGAYISPKVNGQSYVLRHVHLVPILDTTQLNQWDRNFKLRRRRTSNRALVYVKDNERFLLIDVLNEPFAHEIAKMKTAQHRLIMENFALIAEKFIYDDEIIA